MGFTGETLRGLPLRASGAMISRVAQLRLALSDKRKPKGFT